MLRALGIVTNNIDSGRMIVTAADRYGSRSVLQQNGTTADLCGGLAGSVQGGKKKEISHEEKKSNEK